MIAPTKQHRAAALPTLRTGSRVLFLALVCLLAALPAAGLALTSGAATTHPHPGTLPRADVLGLLCRQDAAGAAEAAGVAGGAPRLAPTPSTPRTPPRTAFAAPAPARLAAEPCASACEFAVLGVRWGVRPTPSQSPPAPGQ
ncbi:hypothetical protein [Streptomyces pseudogriseolus]|uniref:hypothetical protein n=1 Tax=Streptomyces pseudogriseolus TaxID=36817 RepID=UPI003FA2825C